MKVGVRCEWICFVFVCVSLLGGAPQQTGVQRSLTSKRWELTFFPFFIQVILGLGSPEAWHTNEATPPEMPV